MFVLPACETADPPARSATVVDSAGVRVVQNAAPAWAEGKEWRITAEPMVSIGAAEGDSADLLYTILSAVRLDDGRIVLADGSRQQLRFYSPDGDLLQTVGRKGEGPGEFDFLIWVGACGDSLYTRDGGLGRLSVFDTAGVYARSFDPSVAGTSGPPMELRCGPRSTLVAKSWPIWEGAPPMGNFRTTSVISVTGPGGETVAVLDSVASDEQYRDPSSIRPRPLGKSTVIATSGSTAFVGTGDEPEIRAYRASGGLERIIRWEGSEREVDDDVIRAYEEQLLAKATDENARRRIANEIREWEFPDQLPAHGEIIADEAGNLWVQRYALPGETASEWMAFDEQGVLLGTVRIPDGVSVMQIGDDFLLGKRTDALGVEFIELYGLSRGASGA